MNRDSLGDRMKIYEKSSGNERLMNQLPAFARLDGKCFHSFCTNLAKPYDKRLTDLMIEVTKYLVEETNAKIGYTQSDEITLSWLQDTPESQIWFDGKIQKMASVLASMCTLKFNKLLKNAIPEKIDSSPLFDCRVWNVPNLWEASNVFLWREQDATRNSIQMASRSTYSHKECHSKNNKELQEMLFNRGINWNDYPDFFKKGTYIQNKKIPIKFGFENIEKGDYVTFNVEGMTEQIGEVLDVRENSNHFSILNLKTKTTDGWNKKYCKKIITDRKVITELQIPILSTIQNRPDVLYYDSEPIVKG